LRNDIDESLARAFHLGESEADGGGTAALPQRFMDKLMPTYFKTRAEDLEKARLALAQQDCKTLKALGHKIKGSSASYGFNKTSELSLRLELAAQTEDMNQCREIVEQLSNLIRSDRKRFLPGAASDEPISPNATS
jgi:HPt (histidine-containing phosphotransfer) domain-containing protein